MVLLIYGAMAVLALTLLYCFHAKWFWHVLSVAAALAIGMMPPELIPVPAAWGATRDVILGSLFTFLVIWGIAAPLFMRHHQAAIHAVQHPTHPA
jgi:hypothetical protein